jgi:hypothetical protein
MGYSLLVATLIKRISSTNCKTDFTGIPDIPGWKFSSVPISPSILSIRDVHFLVKEKAWFSRISEIWLTENEGESWIKVESSSILRINDISFIDQLHGNLAARKDNKACILKTEDGGHTWSTIFYQPADEITHFSYADSLIGIARFSHNENGTSFDRKI